MTRCIRCHRHIWFWQHFGFLTVARGELRWHTGCAQ